MTEGGSQGVGCTNAIIERLQWLMLTISKLHICKWLKRLEYKTFGRKEFKVLEAVCERVIHLFYTTKTQRIKPVIALERVDWPRSLKSWKSWGNKQGWWITTTTRVSHSKVIMCLYMCISVFPRRGKKVAWKGLFRAAAWEGLWEIHVLRGESFSY